MGHRVQEPSSGSRSELRSQANANPHVFARHRHWVFQAGVCWIDRFWGFRWVILAHGIVRPGARVRQSARCRVPVSDVGDHRAGCSLDFLGKKPTRNEGSCPHAAWTRPNITACVSIIVSSLEENRGIPGLSPRVPATHPPSLSVWSHVEASSTRVLCLRCPARGSQTVRQRIESGRPSTSAHHSADLPQST